MSNLNSFEDYHAIKNRQRMKEEAEEEEEEEEEEEKEKETPALGEEGGSGSGGGKKVEICEPTEDDPGPVKHTKPSAEQATAGNKSGKIMELYEVQLLVLLLIYLDLIVASLLIYMETLDTTEGATEPIVESLVRVGDSFLGFTLFFFLLEIVVLSFTYRQNFLLHFGYILDAALVAVLIYMALHSVSRFPRLLGFCRVWRVFRLVNTLAGDSNLKMDDLRVLVNVGKSKNLEMASDAKLWEEKFRRELEGRKRVEVMLRGYKDEVETLSEALKIAAIDVAEAARDQMIEDEEGDEVEGDEFFGGSNEGEGGFVVSRDGTFRER